MEQERGERFVFGLHWGIWYGSTDQEQFTSFSGRKRQLAGNVARKADFDEIPTISLRALEDQIIEQLRDACTRVGFFYIKDHNVPQPIIDQIFATAMEFFDQPFDTKTEIHYKQSSILRGYEPMAEVRTDQTKKADLNEAFNCGYEADLDPLRDNEPYQEPKGAAHATRESFQLAKRPTDTAGDTAMQGPNAWPSMAGFKDSVAAYYGEVLTLARRMVRLFAKVLELPADYFDACVSRPGAMLRLLKYPAQDPSQPDALGIGAHTDIEAFTILCQGSQPALQILNAEGQWIQAPPIPGTFVVNIGDMLTRWSNDVFISTVHRVHASCERYSIPFFFGPSYDTVLHPLPTCSGETGKAGYEPIVAGDYVWQRLAKSRLSKEEAESKSFVQAPAAL